MKTKPQTNALEPSFPVCLDTRNGEPLLQTMNKGTILGIHDNGRELIIGIPENWADFPLDDQNTTMHWIQCYAKELRRQLQFVRTPMPTVSTFYERSSDR
ncbi:MAG: hypothetical protein AB7P17_02200 [Nitrospirales bacterium]|nr:hypothetical protein [Nitrospirales bacterium]